MTALRKHDKSKHVDPKNSSVAIGSENLITKGLYDDEERVALKKIGRFEEGDPKLYELKRELDFIKKLNKCDYIPYK